jgi:hypothetical protein
MAAAACVELLSLFSAHFDAFVDGLEELGVVDGDCSTVCQHMKHQLVVMQLVAQKATGNDCEDISGFRRLGRDDVPAPPP